MGIMILKQIEDPRKKERIETLLLSAGVLAGLYWISQVNYLLFHSLAEMFGVTISFTIFILAWNTRRFLENDYLLILGVASLAVGLIDIVHTLAYKGMGVFPADANLATQLWIASRYLMAISFLLAPLFLRRRVRLRVLLLAFAAITTLIFLSIFSWGIFPDCYIEGVGLTPFKKISEYTISAIFLGSAGLLWLKRAAFDRRVLRLLLISIGFSVVAELAFTDYISVYGGANLLGHFFKIASVAFIYSSVVSTGLRKPYDLLFRDIVLKSSELEKEVAMRTQTEGALRQANERLTAVLESITDGYLVLDQEGRFLEINRAAGELFGRPISELIGQYFREQYPSLAQSNFAARYRESLESGEEQHFETRLPNSNRWFEVHLYPKQTRTEVYFRDISERKQAEDDLQNYAHKLERTNQQLEEFAFIASHDLQEPLRKIQAFSDRVLARYREQIDPDGQNYLDRMNNAAHRMQGMIEDLLALSRVTTQAHPFTEVDFNRLASEVISDLDLRIERSGGRVEVSPLPVVSGDEKQFRLLLQNLIVNALKFQQPGTAPVVRISAQVEQADGRAPEVVIRVEDNGIGFDPKYAERIFHPFQRLHGLGQYDGTGMGLAICRKIVERHGGSIHAESQPGEGATFIVTLPGEKVSAPAGA